MKLQKQGWKKNEEQWVTFEKTKTYENYMLNKAIEKNKKEVKNMEMEVHNQLDINYGKTVSTVFFFASSVLGKFSKKSKWKLEVWLDEKNSKKNPLISCGVALIRPKKNTIYAKKISGNLSEAVKQSVETLEKSIRRESHKWKRYESLEGVG